MTPTRITQILQSYGIPESQLLNRAVEEILEEENEEGQLVIPRIRTNEEQLAKLKFKTGIQHKYK